ncbi:MAG: ferritin-like domain-containing protein [Deltaproteobacteria bacterium]|nr:ferritin-like domain-containing protein [Deltaproteobacteria bacterium]
MDRKAVIKALNDALALEYAAVVQYAQFSYCVKGFRRLAVAGWFFEQATKSLTHARQMGDKIVALGGIPTTRVELVREAQDLTGMVKLSLEMERRSVESYQAALALAADDTALRVLLESRVEAEQADVEELEKMLGDPTQEM